MWTRAVLLLACLAALGADPLDGQRRARGRGAAVHACGDSTNVPLTDRTGPYRGLGRGLYPGGETAPPARHADAGGARAARVVPLDTRGRPAADGRILLLALGMSNTASEFERFAREARRMPGVNPRLVVVNGALSGADAIRWTDPASPAWTHARGALRAGGAQSAAQVQVVWLKQARLRTVPFPAEIDEMAGNLSATLDVASRVFPNLRLAYVSSRTRSGAESRRGPSEPQAYETAFAVRRVVERHLAAERRDVPWVGWGPYLWATGARRSDGLVWECADLQPDLLHPSPSGEQKVADQLMAFFMSDDTAAPWFLDASLETGIARRGLLRASATSGAPPLTVDLSTSAGAAVRTFWPFGDATSSRTASPRKTFHVGGRFRIRVTVVDDAGRWRRDGVDVDVTGGGAGIRGARGSGAPAER